MVKRLTLIFLLLVGSARATVVTTAGSGNMTALAYNANDTLIIANGHTVTVDSTFSTTTPIWRMVFVRSGGTLTWTASKGFVCNALVLGNRASAPFSSSNGGRAVLTSLGYLGLLHQSAFTYDLELGPSADIIASINPGINGTSAFSAYAVAPSTNGDVVAYFSASADSITIQGVRFSHFYTGGLNAGIRFAASRTGAGKSYLSKCYFDTSNVGLFTSTGVKIDQSYFKMRGTDGAAVYSEYGSKDSITSTTILVDFGAATGGCKGLYINTTDSLFVSGCDIQATGENSFNTFAYGINFAERLTGAGGCDFAKIINTTVRGFGFTLGSTASGFVKIDSCNIHAGNYSHEAVILHDRDTNWTIQGSRIYGKCNGGRSPLTLYPSTNACDNLSLFYNTIIGSIDGGNASAAVNIEHTAAGNIVYDNMRFVGNIFVGDNSGFNRAEIILGTTSAQTVTVNFTEFKKNAFDSVYYYGSSSATYPYSRLDSNKHDQTAFAFIDSTNSDFRLGASSPMINCGDTLFGDSVFSTAQHSKIPYDIGYYQSYTTGTCGGAPSTPTGACCYNYTCAVMTQAQCTALSGVYQGNGTSTCSNCTAPQPSGRLFNHAKFAAITYSGSTQTAANGTWLGRHQDLTINPSTTLYTASIAANANHRYINYITLSSFSDNDTNTLRSWAQPKGYNWDTLIIRAGSTVSMPPVFSAGSPCVAGACTTTTINNRIVVCSWNTFRNYPDWNKAGAWDFAIYQAITSSGNYGLMEDEAQSNFYQGNFGAPYLGPINSPGNPGTMWPQDDAQSGDTWCVGSGANAIGWEAYTTATLRRQRMLDIHATQIPRLVDSMNAHGRKIFSNMAAYGRDSAEIIQDLRRYGRSILYGEGMNIGVIGNLYKQTSWNLMDSAAIWGPIKGGEVLVGTYIGDNASNAALPEATTAEKLIRQNFHNYCWYMMASNDYTYFYVHGNNGGSTPPMMANDWLIADSLYKWQNVMAIDLGAATGTRSIVVAGTYPVYRRNFQKGSILYRPGATGADMSSASAVSVSLGRTMYRVDVTPDTTKQAASTTTSLRIGDGAVLVDSTYFLNPTGTITVGDATITEGGTMTFTVTLSAAQSVLTTFNYSTANGTALSGTDYTATSGSKSIPIGSTSTTITVPTTNRSGCQASRAFTVSITGVSPATLTIIDPTGTGTITDDDCGVTIGKSYKGKVIIKGKVKP